MWPVAIAGLLPGHVTWEADAVVRCQPPGPRVVRGTDSEARHPDPTM